MRSSNGQFRAGEIICREGDFGATAFYILDGNDGGLSFEPDRACQDRGRRARILQQADAACFSSRQQDQRNEESSASPTIPIDAPVDLPYQNPIAELGPGDLFGEMTCMSYYPRSATVRAKTDCTMLEMLRNVLDIMQRNKTFREQLDRTYRQRALDSHLRSVPVLASLTPDFIDHLRNRVELLRFSPGTGHLQPGRARRQLLSGAARAL